MKVPTKPTQPTGNKPSESGDNRKNIVRGLIFFCFVFVVAIGTILVLNRAGSDSQEMIAHEDKGVEVNLGNTEDSSSLPIPKSIPRDEVSFTFEPNPKNPDQPTTVVIKPIPPVPKGITDVSASPAGHDYTGNGRGEGNGGGTGSGNSKNNIPQIVRGERSIINHGNILAHELENAVIYAQVRVSPEGKADFIRFEKGSTSLSPGYRDYIIKYLSHTHFNPADQESMLTLKFKFRQEE